MGSGIETYVVSFWASLSYQGKLYIKFDIDFPENGMVSPEARALLVKVVRTLVACP